MNNAKLANALREAATARGYSFRHADDDRLATPATKLPAALAAHPLLDTVDGRRHGRAEYDLAISLLADAARLPEGERNRLRNKLENDAVEIFVALSDADFVIAVRELTVTPQPFSAYGAGEVSVKAQARAITCF